MKAALVRLLGELEKAGDGLFRHPYQSYAWR